ncbi:MAG: phospholipase D family protein [Candidatus Thiodiazotropha sp.]
MRALLLISLSLLSLILNADSLDSLAESRLQHPGQSAVKVLEKGEHALLTRAWLTETADRSIDAQYFIWSTDNIATLASERLYTAAERGVRVRVIVDDLLIDAEPVTLLSLDAHPNIEIRIYNPLHSVGRGFFSRLWHLLTNFRASNQRMHDKLVIYDGRIAITGGRNMADEYFDYDHEYNFRDRDVLAAGAVVPQMQTSFEAFWNSPLSVPLASLLEDEQQDLTQQQIQAYVEWLHAYARNPENFAPEVRHAITDMGGRAQQILADMHWTEASYLHDIPGKNTRHHGLDGGGRTTDSLISLLAGAHRQILIESPYLVMPEPGFDFFAELIARGVKIAIVTNSLASTDNLQAYSGYMKQKQRLLDLGFQIHEFKPRPGVARDLIARHEMLGKQVPVFALHAKSLVIDERITYVGTFNLDPRSTNLNTEVGLVIHDPLIAQQVAAAIEEDMGAENSWDAASDADQDVGLIKRIEAGFWSLLPLDPVL